MYIVIPVGAYEILSSSFVFRTRQMFQHLGLPDYIQTHVHVSHFIHLHYLHVYTIIHMYKVNNNVYTCIYMCM